MNVSRRTFIKASGGTVAALGILGAVNYKDWILPASAEEEGDKVAYTFHPPNCGGRCSFKCTVRDGKLVKIEPNEWPDGSQKKICLRGLSEGERVYSPDRLKAPMKRVGERGEGKFVPISWDEALTTIVDKLHEVRNKYGNKSLVFSASSGVQYPVTILPRILGSQLITIYDNGLDITAASGQTMVMGFAWTNTNEIMDCVNSNMAIFWGNNVLETSMTDAAFFFDAKEAGAKMVCIDPVYSTTASKCNQWITIRPGTDNALLLGMIHLILNNKWYDVEYVRSYTSSPFLIREDNKALLREEGTDKFLVWDKNSNSAQPFDKPSIHPELEGEYTVNGLKVKTVLSSFIEHVEDYTIEWASKTTTIPEEVIHELTREYALGGPASLQWGMGGTDKWYHSDTFGRLATIMAGLTGNIGRIGGGVGQGTQHGTSWSVDLEFGEWELPPEFQLSELEGKFFEFVNTPNSVKAMFLQGNPLHQYFPDNNSVKEWVKGMEFIAVTDSHHCDSVNYADIVLPACTCFESEYDVMNIMSERSHVVLQRKVIEPLFESKSDFEIEKEIAKRMGFEEYMPKAPEDVIRAQLNVPDDPALNGITLENLIANKSVMRLNVPNEPYVSYLDHQFGTDSTKLEFYSEVFIEDNCAFPVYEEPQEASPANPLYQKYPLALGTPHSRFRAHSTYSNARWLLQINAEPMVKINPADGKVRGLANNDLVEVFNDRGSCQCRCQFANDMRPGMVQISEGWWSRYFNRGDVQELTNPNVNPRSSKLIYGPYIAFLDTLVEVKKVKE